MKIMLSVEKRLKMIEKMSENIPPQRSQEWHDIRKKAGNSSQYGVMFNVRGDRQHALRELAGRNNGSNGNKATLAMCWGTLFEVVSGYAFEVEMGLAYRETGSLPHPSFPRIRGSVDGYGVIPDSEKLFVLETKTPFSRIPSDAISDPLYFYQVIQNIEIIDADFGLFNDVRLLPCATEDLFDDDAGRDPKTGIPTICRYAKYGELVLPSVNVERDCIHITMIAVAIYGCLDTPSISHRIEEEGEERMKTPWYGNIFDALTDRHSTLSRHQLYRSIESLSISVIPVGHTSKKGEDAREWVEEMYDRVAGDEDAIGITFFKLDVHLIQVVPRESTFWRDHLLPVALRWVNDVDRVCSGVTTIPHTPLTPHHNLPLPSPSDRVISGR